MTEEIQPAAEKPRGDVSARAGTVQMVLLVLVCVLASAFVVVAGIRIVHPETLSSARAETTDAQSRDEKITTAARKATLAFLDVDYRDMDPRVKKVLALATGSFKKQYDSTSVNLIAAARQGKAVSSGSVLYIGISDADADSAVVFVAADSTVSNTAMEEARAKGEKVDDQRYYRFQLNLSRVGSKWLLNDLQFVS